MKSGLGRRASGVERPPRRRAAGRGARPSRNGGPSGRAQEGEPLCPLQLWSPGATPGKAVQTALQSEPSVRERFRQPLSPRLLEAGSSLARSPAATSHRDDTAGRHGTLPSFSRSWGGDTGGAGAHSLPCTPGPTGLRCLPNRLRRDPSS